MVKVGLVVAKFSENVIRQLTGFKNLNIDMDILYPGGEISIKKINKSFVFPRKINKILYLSLLFKVFFRCLSKKYDFIMNVSGIGINIPLVSLCGRITKTNYFLMYSGNHEEVLARFKLWNPLKRILNRFFKNIIEHSLKKGSKIITLGPISSSHLSEKGVFIKNIKIIPCFIDETRFYKIKDKKRYKNKLSLNVNKKGILFAGRLTKSKGVENLIKIIDFVNSKSNKFEFYILGEGPYFEILKKKKNTLCFGRVDPFKINEYYFAADLLLHPSLTEGLPNVILEALSCGVPVTATPVGEIPWLVKNTFKKPKEFTKYILKEEWFLDRIPFKNKDLEKSYKNLFLGYK